MPIPIRTIIRNRIDASGLTIDQLAVDIRLSRGAIFQWLSGKRLPEAKSLRLLLVATGCDPEDPEAWESWKDAWKEEAAVRISDAPAEAVDPTV